MKKQCKTMREEIIDMQFWFNSLSLREQKDPRVINVKNKLQETRLALEQFMDTTKRTK